MKWLSLLKKHGEKNRVQVIILNDIKWLNEKQIETQFKHSNLPAATNEYSSEYKKQRQELQNCDDYQ